MRVAMIRAPEHPRGCPKAMAPPLTLTLCGSHPNSSRQAKLWAAKASFNSMTSKSLAFLENRWHRDLVASMGPNPMVLGWMPRTPPPVRRTRGVSLWSSRNVRETIKRALAPSLSPDELPAVTVPVLVLVPVPPFPSLFFAFAFAETKDRAQSGQLFQRGVFARALVLPDGHELPLLPLFFELLDRDREDLVVKGPCLPGRDGLAVGVQGKTVLALPGNVALPSDVFGRFPHAVEGEEGLHPGIGETPPQGSVEEFLAPPIRGVGLGEDVGGPGHTLRPPHQDTVGQPQVDARPSIEEGVERGSAKTVDSGAGDLKGKSGEDKGHAGQIAVVFSGLVSATDHHVVHEIHIKGGPVLHVLEEVGEEVVGPHGGEFAVEPSQGGAAGVDDVGLGLHITSPLFPGSGPGGNGPLPSCGTVRSRG